MLTLFVGLLIALLPTVRYAWSNALTFDYVADSSNEFTAHAGASSGNSFG